MRISKVNGKSQMITYKVLIATHSIPCEVTIIDDKEAHKVMIAIEDVKKFAQAIELSTEDYTNMLFKILMGNINNSFINIYNNEVTINKTKQIKLFTKQAQTVDYVETMQIFNDCLYQETCSQNEEIVKLRAQNDSLTEEVQKLEEKLERVIDNANYHENQLYSCVIQVLNEKKKYIQFLKQHIMENDLKASETIVAKRKKVVISDSDTEEYNTDGEQQADSRLVMKRHHNDGAEQQGPSTSNRTMDIDSNILNSDDDADNEMYFTALPPRAMQTADEERVVKQHKNEENMKDTEVKTVADGIPSQEDHKVQDTCKLGNDTPVVTYSTQDLVNDI